MIYILYERVITAYNNNNKDNKVYGLQSDLQATEIVAYRFEAEVSNIFYGKPNIYISVHWAKLLWLDMWWDYYLYWLDLYLHISNKYIYYVAIKNLGVEDQKSSISFIEVQKTLTITEPVMYLRVKGGLCPER